MTRTPRVVAVIDSLGQGGAERSLVDTLRTIGPAWERHIVLQRRVSEGFEDEATAAGITLHDAPGSLPTRVLRLRRLVRDLQPDVVHASLWNSDVASRLALVGRPVPLVSSLVNETYARSRLDGLPLRQRALVAVLRQVDRITSRRVDRFHAVTASVARHFEQVLGLDPTRITVAWRGRDGSRLHPPSPSQRATARADLRFDGTILLCVGRLEEQKGHRHLIEALPAILAAHPDVTMVQTGRDGSAGPSLRPLVAERALEDHVRFDGHQPDVLPYLQGADVFVLPSTYEGIAGAVIEAMFVGAPVVASDLPGVREITRDGELATLVPVRDHPAIAKAVTEIIEAPDRYASRTTAAAEHAAESFTMEAAAKGLVSIYEEAMSQRENAT